MAQQLLSLGQALLLGAVAAALYDVARSLRWHWRRQWLTHCLDGVYAALAGLGLLRFTLHCGQGELRGYVLAAAGVGAALYSVCLGGFLQPLWRFWAAAAADFLHICTRPVGQIIKGGKKVVFSLKKVFYFWLKYDTIILYPWNHTDNRGKHSRKRGETALKKTKTRKNGRRHSRVILLVLLVLIAVVGVEGVRVCGQLSQARQQEEALHDQVQQLQQENAALESDLSRADDPEFIKELAREKMGLAEQGERIFYDVNH